MEVPERRLTPLLDAVTVALLGDVVPEVASGLWLRLTSLTAVVATGLVVVSGVLGVVRTHELWVAFALPPLVALVAAGVFSRRRLLWPATTALGLVLVAAAIGAVLTVRGRPVWASDLHLVLAGLGFAASAVAAATTFVGGETVAPPSWRDYVTLTKPRIMALLLITCVGAMFVGDPRVGPLRVLLTVIGGALASGGASAFNHLLGPGAPHPAPLRGGRHPHAPGGPRRGGDGAPGLALFAGPGGDHPLTARLARVRGPVPGRRRGPRRWLPRPRVGAAPADDPG